MTTPDPLAGELAAIRERASQITDEHGPGDCDLNGGPCTGHDAERLAAAVEAVLAIHRKITLYATAIDARDNSEPPRVLCGHTYLETENDGHLMVDDDSIVCLDKPQAYVCGSCFEEGGEAEEWPCPAYSAVAAALMGEGKPDA